MYPHRGNRRGVSVLVEPDLYEAAERLSITIGISVSQLARVALANYVFNEARAEAWLLSAGIPSFTDAQRWPAEAQSGDTPKA